MDILTTGDWSDRIDSILELLLRTDDSLREGLVGCSMGDVSNIETKFDLRLPAAFTAFLCRVGRSRGQLMPGADFSFPELLYYREVAESLMSDLDDFNLDQRDFVYWMEQGYQFFFFRTGGSDDPAVFFYDNDEPGFSKVYDTFTDWLNVCIQEEIDLRAGRVPIS